MLHEVALTAGVFDRFPASVDLAAGQALVRVLYDVRRTGFLANLYNGSWWADVNKRCNGLAPAARGLILDLLQELHDHGLIIERKKHLPSCPRTDPEWLEESIGSHIAAEFYAIITRKDSLSSRTAAPACVLALEEVLINAYWN